jgi:hypothetical protein
MNIQIKIQCPCCNSPIDPLEHRGVIINQNATLGSRLVSLRELSVRLDNKKPNPPILSAFELEDQKRKVKEQIESAEKEKKILSLILEKM